MKVEILLRAKKDFGTIQEGEEMMIVNDPFDNQNGIVYFPIDLDQWEIVSHEWITE